MGAPGREVVLSAPGLKAELYSQNRPGVRGGPITPIVGNCTGSRHHLQARRVHAVYQCGSPVLLASGYGNESHQRQAETATSQKARQCASAPQRFALLWDRSVRL